METRSWQNLVHRIEQITKARQDGDLPRVLKAFVEFTRKPYTPIKNLLGDENPSIVGPAGVRKQIAKTYRGNPTRPPQKPERYTVSRTPKSSTPF